MTINTVPSKEAASAEQGVGQTRRAEFLPVHGCVHDIDIPGPCLSYAMIFDHLTVV